MMMLVAGPGFVSSGAGGGGSSFSRGTAMHLMALSVLFFVLFRIISVVRLTNFSQNIGLMLCDFCLKVLICMPTRWDLRCIAIITAAYSYICPL